MSFIAYCRVSTDDQSIENQHQSIASKHSINKWFDDEGISGSISASARTGFNECIKYLREGDTLVVTALDRLGRSTIDVLNTIEAIKATGATLIAMREGLDLSTPAGVMMASVFASFAQMEKALMLERQAAGIKRAKAEGKHLGRPVAVDKAKIIELKQQGVSISKIAAQVGCSIATVTNTCKAHRKLGSEAFTL